MNEPNAVADGNDNPAPPPPEPASVRAAYDPHRAPDAGARPTGPRLSPAAATALTAAVGTVRCLAEKTVAELASMAPDQLHEWLQETHRELQTVWDDHLYDDPHRSRRGGES